MASRSSPVQNVAGRHKVQQCSVVPGIPGSGKSVLASLVVDQLQEDFMGKTYATVFAYFDYRDQNRQSPDGVTASLLQQLSGRHSDLPEPILILRKKFKSQDIRPQLQDRVKAFSLVCQQFERVFVVIDALDECDEGKHRQTFIEVLHTLRGQVNVRKAFDSALHIKVEAKELDLKKYLSKRNREQRCCRSY